jgi:hypothetical protein
MEGLASLVQKREACCAVDVKSSKKLEAPYFGPLTAVGRT